MSIPAVDKSYFTEDNYNSIRKKLLDLREICKGNPTRSPYTQVTMSLEILDALSYDHFPVDDVYNFRKALVTTFWTKHNIDIDPNLPLASELAGEEYISLRFEALVSEYHLRLWSCLKVTLKALSGLTKVLNNSDATLMKLNNHQG